MELAARRFARWVLVIHLSALVLIGVLVVLAAREVYKSSRDLALDQARRRQELLSAQTTRGIESYYHSIIDNLYLQRRALEAQAAASQRQLPRPEELPPDTLVLLGRLMWSQLQGRATHLFAMDRPGMTIVQEYSDEPNLSAAQVIAATGPWLKTVKTAQISDAFKLNETFYNLVAVTLPGPPDRVLVAVVSLATVQKLFLADVNNIHLMSAWLVDGDGDVMISFDPRLTGLNVEQAAPQMRGMTARYIQSGQVGTELIDHPVRMGPVELASGLVTIQPINVQGNRWLLGIASGLDEVDAVVQRMFRRAFWWAVFVIVSLMAVLTSTSVFMIRSRLRLERVRRELLTHELDQAREIQLAWLPDGRPGKVSIDVAAVNQPASHISGDFYNWFDLPDGRTVVLIGDVTGHGMAAAFLMATTQLLVRMTITSSADAGKCLDEVNRQLCVQGFSGQFVTMLVLVIDREARMVQVASAGHPAPLMRNRDGVFESISIDPQLVLGVECDIAYETQSFRFAPGAALLLYTDGVTDAVSDTGDRFGLPRLSASLPAASDAAHGLIEAVLNSVERFRNGRPLADDLTLVAVQLEQADAQHPTIPAAAGSS